MLYYDVLFKIVINHFLNSFFLKITDSKHFFCIYDIIIKIIKKNFYYYLEDVTLAYTSHGPL